MNFPAINISVEKWVGEELETYLLFDPYIYTGDEYFQKYLRAKRFCDCQGDIYEAISLKIPPKSWKRFLPAFFGGNKSEVIFRKTNRQMNLEELRPHLLEKVEHFNDEKWEKSIRLARSFEELMS